MIIEASILSADFCRLGEQVRSMEESGAVSRLHVDVMDGRFVPNISIGLPVIESLRRHTRLPLAVHLMIDEPGRYLKEFAAAGAGVIWVHLEACPHVHRDVQLMRELGVKAGVAINPGTPLAALSEVLPDLDTVLVMSVNPGFGGQAFIPGALRRVRDLAETVRLQCLNLEIAVDGGVSETTAGDLVRAGAEVLVIGSALFRHPDGPGAGAAAIRDGLGRA
jgi:ribulose-phosphate 3-epimerase